MPKRLDLTDVQFTSLVRAVYEASSAMYMYAAEEPNERDRKALEDSGAEWAALQEWIELHAEDRDGS